MKPMSVNDELNQLISQEEKERGGEGERGREGKKETYLVLVQARRKIEHCGKYVLRLVHPARDTMM